MLRVSEQYAGTDTGRQRRANEDSLLARSPLFVVADGMGGAQAGEVASRIAIESFQPGVQDASEPELALGDLARAANTRIHELSHSNAEQAGMGTTLTAMYVGEQEVAIAHVAPGAADPGGSRRAPPALGHHPRTGPRGDGRGRHALRACVRR
jgi:protein phosphatase